MTAERQRKIIGKEGGKWYERKENGRERGWKRRIQMKVGKKRMRVSSRGKKK